MLQYYLRAIFRLIEKIFSYDLSSWGTRHQGIWVPNFEKNTLQFFDGGGTSNAVNKPKVWGPTVGGVVGGYLLLMLVVACSEAKLGGGDKVERRRDEIGVSG